MIFGKFNYRCFDGVMEEWEYCGYFFKVGYLVICVNFIDNCVVGLDLFRDGVLIVFFVFFFFLGIGGIVIVLDIVFVCDYRVMRNDEFVCFLNDVKSKIFDLDWIDFIEKVICFIGFILE